MSTVEQLTGDPIQKAHQLRSKLREPKQTQVHQDAQLRSDSAQKEQKALTSLSKLTTLAFLVNPSSDTNQRPI